MQTWHTVFMQVVFGDGGFTWEVYLDSVKLHSEKASGIPSQFNNVNVYAISGMTKYKAAMGKYKDLAIMTGICLFIATLHT